MIDHDFRSLILKSLYDCVGPVLALRGFVCHLSINDYGNDGILVYDGDPFLDLEGKFPVSHEHDESENIVSISCAYNKTSLSWFVGVVYIKYTDVGFFVVDAGDPDFYDKVLWYCLEIVDGRGSLSGMAWVYCYDWLNENMDWEF